MDAHALAEKYPLMSGDEYESFRDDVRANGLRNPIWLHEGKILDGRNRYRACVELGIDPVFAEYAGDDPAGFVDSQNLHRRHLTAEFRRERVRELRATGMSLRAIAKEVGASHEQVRQDLVSEPVKNLTPAPELTAAEPVHGDLASGVQSRTPDPVSEEPDDGPAPPPVAPAKVKGRDGKVYRVGVVRGAKAKAKAAQPNPGVREVVSQLAALTDSLTDGRGFWSAARDLGDEERWELAERLENLSQAMYRRATELRRRSS